MKMPPGRIAPAGQLRRRSASAVQGFLHTGISSSASRRRHHGLRRPDHPGYRVRVRLYRPALARPETSVLTSRKRLIRPVGGASITTAWYTWLSSRRLARRRAASVALPVTSTSDRPGAMVVASLLRPAWSGPSRCGAGCRTSPCSPAARPPGRRRARTRHRPARTPGRRARSPPCAPRRGAAGSRRAGRGPACPRPPSAGPGGRRWPARRPRAAATVVLPVPPLPVTTCSRTPSQSVSLMVMPAAAFGCLPPTEAISASIPDGSADVANPLPLCHYSGV